MVNTESLTAPISPMMYSFLGDVTDEFEDNLETLLSPDLL